MLGFEKQAHEGRGDDDDCQEKTLFSRKRFFVQDKTIKRNFANITTLNTYLSAYTISLLS